MAIVLPRRSLLALGLTAAMLAVAAVPTQARSSDPVPYLALGDSLVYGWDPVTPPGAAAAPDSHQGYPEELARRSIFEVVNASCPGETSGHFVSSAAPDNGCSFVRDTFGLKVDWAGGSQLAYASSFLQENPDTGLVSIQLGANDLFLCQQADADGCTPSEFVTVLGEVGHNLGVAVLTLRATGYTGPIVLVGYYALNYANPLDVAIAQGSRQVLDSVAAALPSVIVADGFSAFEQASRRAGGDPCAAGLLLALPGGGCDIHTSPSGDRVMAKAIHRAVDIGAVASLR